VISSNKPINNNNKLNNSFNNRILDQLDYISNISNNQKRNEIGMNDNRLNNDWCD